MIKPGRCSCVKKPACPKRVCRRKRRQNRRIHINIKNRNRFSGCRCRGDNNGNDGFSTVTDFDSVSDDSGSFADGDHSFVNEEIPLDDESQSDFIEDGTEFSNGDGSFDNESDYTDGDIEEFSSDEDFDDSDNNIDF
jgi:hypothetical protein